MTTTEALEAVLNEVNRARAKYPKWPDNIVMAAAVASEESGETVKACNNYFWRHGNDTPEDIQKEAIQAAAMWIRFLVDTPAMNGYPDQSIDDLKRQSKPLTQTFNELRAEYGKDFLTEQ